MKLNLSTNERKITIIIGLMILILSLSLIVYDLNNYKAISDYLKRETSPDSSGNSGGMILLVFIINNYKTLLGIIGIIISVRLVLIGIFNKIL